MHRVLGAERAGPLADRGGRRGQHEPGDPGVGRCVHGGNGAGDVDRVELGRVARAHAVHARHVEHDVAPVHRVRERRSIDQVTGDGLGSQIDDRRLRDGAAREGPDGLALRDQRPDHGPADEPTSSGNERRHRSRTRVNAPAYRPT